MKKVIIMVTVIVMVIAFVGCGKDTKETEKNDGVEDIRVEEIRVEEIRVEEIQVEEIQTERIYIDGEYESESDYNSNVNTWENSTTYWD